MKSKSYKMKAYQRGFISYVFLVIALLAIVGFAAAKMSRAGTHEKWTFDARNTILDQYTTIRTRVISCGINYPSGNNGTGFHIRFPATPVSTLVSDMVCPGQTLANNLWTGVGGLTAPVPPAGFSPWIYTNDGTSIRISLTATVGTTDLQAMRVLNATATKLGSIATVVGPVLTITLMI